MLCAVAFGQQPVQKPELPKTFKPMYIVRPWKDAAKYKDAVRLQSASGTTIPLWTYSLTSPVDNQQYSGMIVGRAPYFHGHRTTTVPTLMVPVIFTFADTGTVFDPTITDPCLGDSVVNAVSNSPVFQPVDWVMNGVDVGSTQYIDGFQRAEFWTLVGGTPQHTVMGLSVLPAISITVPTQFGQTYTGGSCGPLGLMDLDWWDSMVQNTLIPSLAGAGVGPTNLPLFLFDSVVEYENGDPNQCCVLGYHSAYTPNGTLQTYSIGSFDTSGAIGNDISTMSHEIGEWMNDPSTGNPTPAWGHIGQVQGCQNNFEVGDPLSPGYGTPTNEWSITLNGFTYHLQELAFFSWFYRQSPSLGSGGLYSDNGTFTKDAGPVCQ
jgi:hypothetical protein